MLRVQAGGRDPFARALAVNVRPLCYAMGMTSHDQLIKDLIRSMFRHTIELFYPAWAKELFLDQVEFLDKEFFVDLPQGSHRFIDILARSDRGADDALLSDADPAA